MTDERLYGGIEAGGTKFICALASEPPRLEHQVTFSTTDPSSTCLLYTSDAADDLLCVDLGGRRIIKKKQQLPILAQAMNEHTSPIQSNA